MISSSIFWSLSVAFALNVSKYPPITRDFFFFPRRAYEGFRSFRFIDFSSYAMTWLSRPKFVFDTSIFENSEPSFSENFIKLYAVFPEYELEIGLSNKFPPMVNLSATIRSLSLNEFKSIAMISEKYMFNLFD